MSEGKTARQIEKCETAIRDEKYAGAVAFYTAGKYEEAIAAFTALDGYKDSAAQIEKCETAIIHNRIRCNHCGDVIESEYRHDFKSCRCGRVSVDGGHSYLRRCFTHSPTDYTDLSEVEHETDEDEPGHC